MSGWDILGMALITAEISALILPDLLTMQLLSEPLSELCASEELGALAGPDLIGAVGVFEAQKIHECRRSIVPAPAWDSDTSRVELQGMNESCHFIDLVLQVLMLKLILALQLFNGDSGVGCERLFPFLEHTGLRSSMAEGIMIKLSVV